MVKCSEITHQLSLTTVSYKKELKDALEKQNQTYQVSYLYAEI